MIFLFRRHILNTIKSHARDTSAFWCANYSAACWLVVAYVVNKEVDRVWAFSACKRRGDALQTLFTNAVVVNSGTGYATALFRVACTAYTPACRRSVTAALRAYWSRVVKFLFGPRKTYWLYFIHSVPTSRARDLRQYTLYVNESNSLEA